MNTLTEPADPKTLATAYALGELSDAERAAFEARMENDPALATLVEETKSFCGLLDHSLREPVPSLAEEKRAALMTAAMQRQKSRRLIFIPWLAAGAAACVAGGFLYSQWSEKPADLLVQSTAQRSVYDAPVASREAPDSKRTGPGSAEPVPEKPATAAANGLRYQPTVVLPEATAARQASLAASATPAAEVVPVSTAPLPQITIKPDMPKPLFAGTPLPQNNPPQNLDKSGRPIIEIQVPEGTRLVSKGASVTCSDEMPLGELSWITDGEKNGDDGYYVDILPGKQWVQIDLGKSFEIHLLWVWHFHKQAVIYKDVVVQVSDDPEFKGAVTVFNNDWDNSAGFGTGKDLSWVETNNGRAMPVPGIKARYVRLWSNGRDIDDTNQYIEVEVYGREPGAALAAAAANVPLEILEKALESERRGDEMFAKQDLAGAGQQYLTALEELSAYTAVADHRRIATKYANASVIHAAELAHRGEFQKAKTLVAGVLEPKRAPNHPGAQLLLKQLDDPDKFQQSAQSLTAANTEEVKRLLTRGLGYSELGQYQEAEAMYNRVLAIDPYNTAARQQLERNQRELANYYKTARDHTRLRLISKADSLWIAESAAAEPAKAASSAPVTVRPEMPKPLFAGTPLPMTNPPPNLDRSGSVYGDGRGRGNGVGAGYGPGYGPGSGPAPAKKLASTPAPEIRDRELYSAALSTTVERREYAMPVPEPQSGSESYAALPENPFLGVAKAPLSTFSIDVDTASYSNVRRYLNMNQAPPPEAVRLEELVNYFPYDYAQPADGKPFAVHVEMTSAPWNAQHRLARIALKGKEIHAAERPAANLVFLVDVSGSMQDTNKLPLVKQSLRFVVERLTEKDTVSLVTYAGESGVALPATSGADKARIMAAIDGLGAGGSTNGAGGINSAYAEAAKNFRKEGINRVILATDGDFNVGVTSHGDLQRLIEEKRATGVFLSVLGYGMGNTKDDTMELLSNKGNGNYAYIDSLSEARKALGEQFSGTLVTIAKDVKIQIEFNPAIIRGYRLLGYENRMLAKEDFNNDKKDAGEIGAGHTVTALYELVPVGAAEPVGTVDNLRYQQPKVAESAPAPAPEVPAEVSGETMTVKLRWKAPDADVSQLMEVPVKDTGAKIADASPETKWAVAVAGFASRLRNSQFAGMSWEDIRTLAKAGKGTDPNGYRGEFLQLLDKAESVRR